jgi:predicted MFS family arabinose efflux permease
MGFSAVTFYLSLYLQEVKHQTALEITVKLLPMVVSGVLVNVICGLILHRVSNKVLTGIGALAYTASFLILSFMKEDATYWAFIFPALVLVVVGADIQFNVTNVRPSTPHIISLLSMDMFGFNLLTLLDVRDVLSPTIPTIHRRRNFQHGQQTVQQSWSWHCYLGRKLYR